MPSVKPEGERATYLKQEEEDRQMINLITRLSLPTKSKSPKRLGEFIRLADR